MEEPVNKKRKTKRVEGDESTLEESQDLLPEILEKIFGYLEFVDLRNCSVVNRRWNGEAKKKIMKCIIHLCDFTNLESHNMLWDSTDLSIFKEQIKPNYYKNNRDNLANGDELYNNGRNLKFKVHHLTLDELRLQLNEPRIKRKQIWLRTNVRNIGQIIPWIREAVFYNCRNSITHLSLSSSPTNRTRYSIPVNKFLTLLNKFLPQLEVLNFENSSVISLGPPDKRGSTAAEREMEKSSQQLANLKTIRFKTPFQFHEMSSTPVYHILVNSPNLQSVHGFPFEFLKKLHSARKAHTLKSLRFINHNNHCGVFPLARFNAQSNNDYEKFLLGDKTNLRALKKLAQTSSVSLEELKMFMCFKDPQITNLKKNAQIYKSVFTSFLSSSAETLVRLDLQPLEFLSFISFPVPLKNLKTLGLHGDIPAPTLKPKPDRKFFPSGFNFSVIFPNLTDVDLSIQIRDAAETPLSIFHDFFPTQDFVPAVQGSSSSMNNTDNCGPFKCIESLKILKYMPLVCMERVAGLFSNCSSLTLELTNFLDLRKILRMIFNLSSRHWFKLQRLFIDLKRVKGGPASKSYWNLDEEITGLTEEKCQDLRNESNLQSVDEERHNEESLTENEGENIELFRLNPSIINMKDLKFLQFILPMWIEQNDEPLLIFSQVSAIYGFAMLPLLRVHIRFEDYFRYKTPRRLKPLMQEPIGRFVIFDDDEDDDE